MTRPLPDIFACFLQHRRGVPLRRDLRQQRNLGMLCRALNLGTTVAFVGSGLSQNFKLPNKLPNWKEFAMGAVLMAWESLKPVAGDAADRKDEYKTVLKEFGKRLQMDRVPLAALGGSHIVTDYLTKLEAAPAPSQDSNDKPSGDELRFILGACKRIAEWGDSHSGMTNQDRSSYLGWLKQQFTLDDKCAGHILTRSTVHQKLLQLPFHRFVTSNYDPILDWCVASKLRYKFRDLQQFRKLDFAKEKIFTHKDLDSGKLAGFAAGWTEESRNMVFHCHGSCGEAAVAKDNSMIVTEEDYQALYLDDAQGAGIFRQTMDLLVGSHPILFVGFGMNDPDLLMAFRGLSACEPQLKSQRPVFALLDREESAPSAAARYYDQYGVHVIDFIHDGDPGKGLENCLTELKSRWEQNRRDWLLKPRLRRVKAEPKGAVRFWHYKLSGAVDPDSTTLRCVDIGPGSVRNDPRGAAKETASEAVRTKFGEPQTFRVTTEMHEVNVDAIASEITGGGKPPLIVIFGAGGSGKSWFAMRLMNELRVPATNAKYFFWSSYYADDALTGMDRAIDFLPETPRDYPNEQDKNRPRRKAFLNRLQGNHVLVFDGIERFLRPDKGVPEVGAAVNSGVTDFLNCLLDDSVQSTVVLTTRLLPREFLSSQSPLSERVQFYTVTPTTAQIARTNILNGWVEENVADLVALLDGHRYAIELASSFHNRHEIQGLIRHLADVGTLRRVDRMVEIALGDLDKTGDRCNGDEPYGLLMKRLAAFMGPIRRDTTFEYCHDLAKREWEKLNQLRTSTFGEFPDQNKMWDLLVQRKLLFNIEEQGPPPLTNRCVMHAVVREFIFHRLQRADARRLANFTQAGFTSGTAMVDPGPTGAKVIKDLFLRLRKECRAQYGWDSGTPNFDRAKLLCQDAFGVLRSRMMANTVPRWGSYGDYIHLLARMGDLVRAYCGKRGNADTQNLFWNHCGPVPDGAAPEDDNAPLFGDELAWLYHELGLALYHEGSMIDCLSIWELGLEINKILDQGEDAQYSFQSYCNLGAASIQYGRLPNAREYFERAKRISGRTGEKDHAPRIDAYLALIRHLRGDLLLADQEYRTALERLAKIGNDRAESIFLRHRADLKITLKQADEAWRLIRSARAKAEEGHFPDLVAQARIAEGHIYRMNGGYKDAMREYQFALEAAKKYGMRSLEADVLCELARISLDLGDREAARARAVESLQIANELHLGLRQTHGLVVLGKATVETKQRTLGIGYLRIAKQLAERQHYELRAREAEEELHRLGALSQEYEPLPSASRG